ncbi:hypothetical protein N7540_011217 [Penicillium herquei]|nr:hypothetical protein N7540_011217 [Penicillium herquei]
MPSSSWGTRTRWRHTLFVFLFFISGLVALFIWPALQNGHSAPLVERSQLYTWEGTEDLPFHIDADTWAEQHRNHTFDRRQTVSTSTQQTYTCSKGTACSNGACCGESGVCGYGSTYCGAGCTSNCNATAPCGQYSSTGNATCPLNVCCSEWGFCGTTSDFCGTGCQSNCRTPSSPSGGGDVRNTIIGYYESWRSGYNDETALCDYLDPSQIPIQALTGVNYAFAYITPGTYTIVPMSGYSDDLFIRVANIKASNPDAKVWLSVGGWSFSDNGTTTQAVFGDIASTILKRAQFGANLLKFMVQYGFDGVDIDWEYPGAPDRGGQAEDVANYPLLLQMLQYQFKVAGKDFGISITAPTSYWYLRWFDLTNIVKYVDYINLMSYDLHGVWDSTDPIGPYVYAHTNLTDIDAALSLFWRNNIDPLKINLGLAFYGRSFELKDPSCMTPGCEFNGPGKAGGCTNTAGILSYAEIEDIINSNPDSIPVVYDPVAGVNYLVYGDNNWVSFDDKTTFQQKIDFANANGLNGLFIWAIDMDDSSFTALKAVTGTDLEPTVGPSETIGNWNVNDCFTTPCGVDCAEGFKTMTELNYNDNGQACSKGLTRSLCCAPWGAPDPATCKWNGSPNYCYGQCAPGEVLFATDKCGGSKCCSTGVKAYCCPATNGAAAVAACGMVKGSCSTDLPQQIGTIGDDYGVKEKFCCPSEPTFSNCSWYGSNWSCNNNRCPTGQIEMARSKNGDGSFADGCIFGRQKVLCCDPPYNGTAFLPVSLDYLFPESLPTADAPVYYEAFDHPVNERPVYQSEYTDDPNGEPFAWTIMVGAEADVQSLRKRDGSHLETFDCPSPAKDDYSVQSFKAVCTVEGDEHNCEDIKIGSVRGTIIRLPEECGPDEWVRVVSFKELDEHPVPMNLSKRLHASPKVYEIKYDYNLRLLRRDGGEVYVRFDASVHPGYWDEIVASSPTGSVKRRSPEDWREFHMDWFNHRQLGRRGYGESDSWWLDRFNSLLNGHHDYGLVKEYTFSQTLYEATISCPPVDATFSAGVSGTLGVTLDYGLSLIGTLRNFDFSESYAYFNLYGLDVYGEVTLNANAAIQYQSQVLQLLDQWDPFGGSYNIKGLWTVGPYFDVTAQLQALATVSGTMTAGVGFTVYENFTYMFPQSLNQWPSQSAVEQNHLFVSMGASSSAAISAAGSVTMTVTPSVGFQIQLEAFDTQLVNTKVQASFENAMTLRVGASSASLCDGVEYEIENSLMVNINLENPLPGWDSGSQSIEVYGEDRQLLPMKCYPWRNSATKRDGVLLDSSDSDTSSSSGKLVTRDTSSFSVLFPDTYGAALGCPNNKTTPTGNCKVDVYDDPDGYDTSLSKRASEDNDLPSSDDQTNLDEELQRFTREFHELTKRSDRKYMSFCGKSITSMSPTFPSSSDLINAAASSPFLTYGPLNPTNCDDYSFGQVATPPSTDSSNWATEHVLEWQLYTDFWQDMTESATTFTDPSTATPKKRLTMCQYIKFWWDKRNMVLNGVTGHPIDLVANAFPSGTTFRSELMLLDKNTNSLKEKIWGDSQVRQQATMMQYLNGNNNYDFNSAVNVCKYLIFAMDYVTQGPVSQVLVTQATRIGQYFDDMETTLAAYNDPTWNYQAYQTFDLGDNWRQFMWDQWDLQLNKQRAFLDSWVPQIESYFRADEDGDQVMGGFEDNQDVLAQLTAQVISYLIDSGSDPAPYATVNREWQMIIEQRTFKTINLKTSERLAAFKQIVAQNTRRKTCIREINLIAELEPYSIEARAELETAEEHRRNNEIFVSAIQLLFSILESWPENEPGIYLDIEAMSPSDVLDRQRARKARREPEKDLRRRRFEMSYLEFSEDHLGRLPVIHAVTELSIGNLHLSRLFLPASCALIASKFPRLHQLNLMLSDDEKRDKALRKQNRNEFARHLHLFPSSIKELSLAFASYAPQNQYFAPANLVDGKIEDPFSSALRDFSQQLTVMRLEQIVVGKELFWPINPTDDMKLPTWPNLTHVYLEFGMATPSGEWLFERDPEEANIEPIPDREEHLPEHKKRALEDRVGEMFRLKATPRLMNGLYLSPARAAQRMPQLKIMSIRISEGHNHLSFEYKVDGSTAKATWDCDKPFTPDEPVLQAWRDAGFRHTGVESEIEVKYLKNTI